MGLRHSPRLIAFGPFEFDENTGELNKRGVRIRLQEQPRTILRMLLERSGEVVEREEIRSELWPASIHVDFDRSVNAAVGRLRQVLCDCGARPIYVERIPKRGYRFIAPVTERQVPPPHESAVQRVSGEVAPTAGVTSGRRERTFRVVFPAAAIVFAIPLLFLFSRSGVPSVVRTDQITNDGRSKSPWLATDGARLYLTEYFGGATHLFQAPIGGGTPEMLPTPFTGQWPQALDTFPEHGEVMVGTNVGLFIWSIVQNRTRRVSELQCDFAKWSPEHSRIACATRKGLELMDVDGSHRRVLQSLWRTQSVAWRPNGKAILYSGVRRLGERLEMHEYDLIDGSDSVVSGDKLGEAVPGVFLRDGWHVYSSAADHNLYAVRDHGSPVALTRGPVKFYNVTSDAASDRLYAMGEVQRGELARFSPAHRGWEQFLAGRSADALAWSPRGDYVAYVTYPEGELWRSRVDGSDSAQLTSRSVRAYHPSWSPDGRLIAYSAAGANGVWRIFATSPDGGAPFELTPGSYPGMHECDPVWSPDGREIAFAPTAELASPEQLGIYILDINSKQVHRVPGTEGLFSPRWEPRRAGFAALDRQQRLVLYDFASKLTRVLADEASGWPHWSKDGRHVYFLEGGRQTIARVPRDGGAVELIVRLTFPTTGNTFSGTWDHNFYVGFGPDDAPVVLRDLGTSELYSLSLEWK